MKSFIVFFMLLTMGAASQEVKTFTYSNGQPKTEVTFDKKNVITKCVTWDQFGNVLSIEDFSVLYKNYPKKDFSKLNWTKVNDGVSISKLNKKDTNVVVTDSSFVTYHYQCYFANGNMIDNSFAKGCPMEVRLDYMVKGFILGLKQMKPGETAFIQLEPSVAFGEKPMGNIPPHSTLIYLIELISVSN